MRLKALDGLRASAALGIILLHRASDFNTHGAGSNFIANCYLLVDLFFVLSGFVICLAYRERLISGAISFRGFVKERLFRIYPIHALIITGYVLVGVIKEGSAFLNQANVNTLFHQLLLLQSVVFSSRFVHWNDAAWFVSVIFWVYVLYPLYLARAYKINTTLLSAVCLVIIPLSVVLSSRTGWDTTTKYGIFRGICGFFAGHLLGVHFAFLQGLHLRFVKTRWAATFVEILSLLLVVLFLAATHKGLIAALFYLPSALLVFVLACNRGTLSRFLSTSILVWLGSLSYDIYMLHLPITGIWKQAIGNAPTSVWQGDLHLVAAIFLVVLVAWLLRRTGLNTSPIKVTTR